jgi:glutathione S-transferase
MYTLYYSPGACSMAVHVALNECDQPVKLERVDLRAPRTPEFLALNPRGQVPVLVDDGFVMREGAAILTYLLEKHKSPLLPASGKERAAALEWLAFCNATLHPAYGRAFFVMRAAPEEAKQQMLDTAIGQINKLWAEVEDRLGRTAFLAGDQITVADILMTVLANWIGYFPDPAAFKFGPRAKKLFQTVIARPAYKKALEAEKVEYKAAA